MPEILIILIVLGLGTARISAIISMDVIFEKLRHYIFLSFPPEDNDAVGYYYQCYQKANKKQRELNRKRHGEGFLDSRYERLDYEWRKPHIIGKLISCHKCVSVWVAIFNVILYHYLPQETMAINTAFAISFISMAANNKYYR